MNEGVMELVRQRLSGWVVKAWWKKRNQGDLKERDPRQVRAAKVLRGESSVSEPGYIKPVCGPRQVSSLLCVLVCHMKLCQMKSWAPLYPRAQYST